MKSTFVILFLSSVALMVAANVFLLKFKQKGRASLLTFISGLLVAPMLIVALDINVPTISVYSIVFAIFFAFCAYRTTNADALPRSIKVYHTLCTIYYYVAMLVVVGSLAAYG